MPKFLKTDYEHWEKVYEKVCEFCAHTYFSKRPGTLYCCNPCRQNAYILRKTNNKSIETTLKSDFNEIGIEDDNMLSASTLKAQEKYLEEHPWLERSPLKFIVNSEGKAEIKK